MPGRYTRGRIARVAVNDPQVQPLDAAEVAERQRHAELRVPGDLRNDQNLIHVAGRAIDGDPLASPRADRHGIPEQELGKCIRCNLQIEGSGVKPEDVLLDAGKNYIKPKDPMARPGGDLPRPVRMPTTRTPASASTS